MLSMKYSAYSNDSGNVVIHQPDFIPYLGFFERLIACDFFIIQDSVQFNKRGWVHRDRINSNNGPIWLSLPLNKKEMSSKSKINEISLLSDELWRKKHLQVIKESYLKSKFFDEIFPLLRECYQFPSLNLSKFNMNFIYLFLDLLDLRPKIVFASDLPVEGKSNELLVNQMKFFNRSDYLSGDGARDYLDEKYFAEHGITVRWQNFNHPKYQQNFPGFVSHLSIIDCLFNCGVSATKRIISGEVR